MTDTVFSEIDLEEAEVAITLEEGKKSSRYARFQWVRTMRLRRCFAMFSS